MNFNFWVDAASLASGIGVPIVAALIGWQHHRNAARWKSIFSKIEHAKRLAKRANSDHISFAARLESIETRLSECKSRIRNQEN